MSMGLQVLKEDGNPLFSTDMISYGLLKSGYCSEQTRWPRLYLRSAQLDPSKRKNWAEFTDWSRMDRIYGFTVQDAIAPIVFINGSGVQCGSSLSGNTTTFYFIGANSSTKYYYFDTMRDTTGAEGLKCWTESGVLTFNSAQPPLNVVTSLQAPPPPTPYAGRYYALPYEGGTRSFENFTPADAGAPTYLVCKKFMSIGPGEFAASITFSRNIGSGRMDFAGVPAGTPSYVFLQSNADGAFGTTGGIYFMTCDAPRTTQLLSSTYAQSFFDIPQDRYPNALVIRSDILPFPFN